MENQNGKNHSVKDENEAPCSSSYNNNGASNTGNMDEEIRAYEDGLQEEIAAANKLIGPFEPSLVLRQEYVDNPQFLEHIEVMLGKYSHWRRIRKDGNCFYRAFIFGALEYFMTRPKRLHEFRAHIQKVAQAIVHEFNYQTYIIEDMHEPFDELLKSLEDPGMTSDSLAEMLNEQGYSDYYVAFLRLIVSCQLQRESELFSNFIPMDQASSIKEFCSREVEPMAKEADHVHITALTHALRVSIRIESVDPRSHFQHVFSPPLDGENGSNKSEQDNEPVVTLLFKPGHYDIIYAAP